MVDALLETNAPLPIPGFWRLGWLLLMQPLTLHRQCAKWELDNSSLWKLRWWLKEGNYQEARALVARFFAWLLLVIPLSMLMVAGCFAVVGLAIHWSFVAFFVVIGVADGVARGIAGGGLAGNYALDSYIISNIKFGFFWGLARGISCGVIAGGLAGAFQGIAGGSAFDMGLSLAACSAVGVASSVAQGITRGVAGGVARGTAESILLGVTVGFIPGLERGVTQGAVVGVAVTLAFALGYFQLAFYPVEVALIAIRRLTASLRPASLPFLTTFLPYRHHDLIYLPLPFLSSFLVHLGEEDVTKCRQALAEATASLGQRGQARRALLELQARSFERAARERRYASAAALTLSFLSGPESLRLWTEHMSVPSGYIALVDSIATAAQDLEAARSTSSHHQRSQALTRARKKLERTLDRLTATRRLSREERRFVPVAKGWLDRVADEEAALAALERKQPQVPLVFVAGVPLTPADESLFVGRRGLVRLLDQDLATERPVPLVLLGQRRIGKSTLLNFLPRLLGTGTHVVSLNFQGLSGTSLRREPHCWVAAEVAKSLAGASSPPKKAHWEAILNWLSSLEEPLAASGRRLLIALDEVEGLERGIREGWSDPSFLDFLRAAGDRLRRIRFLLVTAHPFSRLGPHWSDRLISAQTRRIGPLAEEEARMLLTQPVSGFPDIYPADGVERLLAATACHPYLLQLTAYLLTRRLNDINRLKAIDDDLTAALDQALEENSLFQTLWDDLSVIEQQLLATLARGEKPSGIGADELGQVCRELAREQFIQRVGEGEGWRMAVPLFARWIREIGAAG